MSEHLDKKALLQHLHSKMERFEGEKQRGVAGIIGSIASGKFDAVEDHLIAVQSVIDERQRQNVKWGEENHEPIYWLGILGEEYGELCQAITETVFNNGPEERLKGGYANMRAEAVQVAAVAVAFVEMLDRRYSP